MPARRFWSFRSELRPVLQLAGPIALMQAGMVLFGTVATLLAGRIGPQAIAGLGLGNAFYFMTFVCASGLLLGIDPLSSRAFGEGRPAECARVLTHAAVIAVFAGVPIFVGTSWAGNAFALIGVDPAISEVSVVYLRALRWHVFPTLLFTACRQYLQSMGITRPQLAAVIAGNALNVVLGYALVFGAFGLPSLGVRGAAWGIVGANSAMFAVAAWASLREMRRARFAWTGFDRKLVGELLRLGTPAAMQLAIETGAFGGGSLLMGRLGATATAAHQIALNLASLTFMVPLGVGHAASVLVGQGIGRGRPRSSARAGYAALALGVGFMALMSAVFISVPAPIAGLYTKDPEVLPLAVSLLAAMAAFQMFDGCQVVLTGALRGMGETRLPMLANAVGYWVVGLPIGALLAFRLGVGALGIWIGFCLSLATVALSLLLVWMLRARELERQHQDLGPHPEEAFDLASGVVRS